MQRRSKNPTPSASIQSCLLHVSNTLAENHIEAGMQEASILLQHITGLTLTGIYSSLQQPLSTSDISHLESLVQRRLRHEPLQYIVASSTFYGLEFYVDDRVLIPRPETELLVDIVLSLCRDVSGFTKRVRVADVGTGSGAIAVTIARQMVNSSIVAIDASSGALAVATINRDRHSVTHQVDLVQGDLLSPFQGMFDIVVANLPYIATETIEGLNPEVRCFEPRMALDGGPDGLRELRRLLTQAETSLCAGGWLLLELGAGQSTAVVRLMEDAACWQDVCTRSDLQGIERVVMGTYTKD